MKTKVGLGKERRVKIRGNMVEKGFIAPIYKGKLIVLKSDT
ncbi:MAG: hypothetical protein CM15mP58_19990 [Burkholderiaceae bacterium]|nr:MAG: hypothetical protein CM15mP58_19990 [Burkholderiaceae bacterium]